MQQVAIKHASPARRGQIGNSDVDTVSNTIADWCFQLSLKLAKEILIYGIFCLRIMPFINMANTFLFNINLSVMKTISLIQVEKLLECILQF